jgi:hypothetical protein
MNTLIHDPHCKNFQAYFDQNKHKDWDRWLIPLPEDKQKDMSGKQGYVGVLQHPHNKAMTCIYKISKTDDNLVEHEYKILKGLEPLTEYTPHFHKAYGLLPFFCNVHYSSQPLEVDTDSKIVQRTMLLMQQLSVKCDLNDLIQDEKVKDESVLNIMKQVVLALYMAQDYGFTHYDLHTENILVRTCNPNQHILYLLDDTTEILIPTFGFIPNIIDFGFSFCDVEDNELTCTLVHTQCGFTSARFDPFADIKLFMITTVDDIIKEECRKNISKNLKHIVRNIFGGMKVHWRSGWDKSKFPNPVKVVQKLVKDWVEDSVLFSKSDLWFDTIQELITLPLEPLSYEHLETCCKTFITEFLQFEERVVSKTLLNYVLKLLVRHVKSYRSSFLKGGDERVWAVSQIKKDFLDDYNEIINYHLPKIDYDRLVQSLLDFSCCLEGIFYETLNKRYQEKDAQYEIMRIKELLEFYKVLELNFPYKNQKTLTIKSNILVVDHVRKMSKQLNLTKENLHHTEKLTPEQTARYLRSMYEAEHHLYEYEYLDEPLDDQKFNENDEPLV